MVSQLIWRPVDDFTPLNDRRLLLLLRSGAASAVLPGFYHAETRQYVATEELETAADQIPWAVSHWAEWPLPPAT